MDEQAFRNIGSALSGLTSNTASGSITTGGSVSYTPDQLRSAIPRLINLADGFYRSRENAQYIASVQGPGLEYASQSHASVVRASGRSYMQSLENDRRACLAVAQTMRDTLDDYLGLDHGNVERMNRAGPPGDQPGPRAGI